MKRNEPVTPIFASGYRGDADELCSQRVLLPMTRSGLWETEQITYLLLLSAAVKGIAEK